MPKRILRLLFSLSFLLTFEIAAADEPAQYRSIDIVREVLHPGIDILELARVRPLTKDPNEIQRLMESLASAEVAGAYPASGIVRLLVFDEHRKPVKMISAVSGTALITMQDCTGLFTKKRNGNYSATLTKLPRKTILLAPLFHSRLDQLLVE